MTPDAAGCNAAVAFVPPATCAVTGNDCTLGINTVFEFLIPWNQRWVKWNVMAETANVGQGKTISGQVVCAAPNKLLSGTTTINIQAMASFRNDTTSDASDATSNGYDLYSIPHASPNTRGILGNETTLVVADDAPSTTDDWTLKIVLLRSPLVHVVNISRPLSLFPLLSLCLSTVLSFFGVWRFFFKRTENCSWRAMNLWNKRQAKRARNDARDVAGNGCSDGARSGNDAPETKNDDDGLEMQADVRIAMTTELFDDQRSPPPVVNPAYGDRRATVGDDAQRIARLEKRVDEAKVRAYKTASMTDMCVNEMKSRVGVAEKRADVAEKRADDAELVAEQREEHTIARMLVLEQMLERAMSRKEGGEPGSGVALNV